jgi:hypothetical protein
MLPPHERSLGRRRAIFLATDNLVRKTLGQSSKQIVRSDLQTPKWRFKDERILKTRIKRHDEKATWELESEVIKHG